jgi:hypothetical protein
MPKPTEDGLKIEVRAGAIVLQLRDAMKEPQNG